MPIVNKVERYVDIAYQLHCGDERAEALSNDLNNKFKEKGFVSSKNDTRGWDGDYLSVIIVTYGTLNDAIKLDKQVRNLLSRKCNYTYRFSNYSDNPITTLTPLE